MTPKPTSPVTSTRAGDETAWRCAARRQSLPEPADCNWPDCGCDPHATKVIEALLEQGWSATSSASEKVCDHPSTEKAAQLYVVDGLDKKSGKVNAIYIFDNHAAALKCRHELKLSWEHLRGCNINSVWENGQPFAALRAASLIANPANSLSSQPEPSLLGRETVREALEEIEKIAGVVGYVGFEICADLAADLLKQVETIRACERPSDDTDNIAWDILAEERLGQRPRERPSLSPLKE